MKKLLQTTVAVFCAWTASAAPADAQLGALPGASPGPYAPPARSAPGEAPLVMSPGTESLPPGAYVLPTQPSEEPWMLQPFFDGLDCFSQRYNRFYIAGDAFAFDRSEPFRRIIAVSNGNGGTRLRTTDPNFTHEAVPRLTIGYVFQNNWAVESQVYWKDDIAAIANWGQTNDVDAAFFGLQPAASDWRGADQINQRLSTGIHSYEANLINTVAGIQPIVGFRYIEYRDLAAFTTFDDANRSDASIGTYNKMLGGQIGARTNWDWGLTGLTLTGKVGMYYNDAHINTNVRDANNTTTVRDLHRGGQNEAYQYEVEAMFYYRPRTWLALRGGYEVFAIYNTAHAVDQIADTAADGTNSTGGIANAKGDIILHGPSAGVEIRW